MALLLVFVAATGCGSSATSSGGTESEAAPMKLKVLADNTEYGGVTA